jgi:hypothetical protein
LITIGISRHKRRLVGRGDFVAVNLEVERVKELRFSIQRCNWWRAARAQFKGWGTINGEGNYTFILTAIDGQVNGGGGYDRFRIKIWDEASGTKIYDNQHGTDDTAGLTGDGTRLQGGSIVIQKK